MAFEVEEDDAHHRGRSNATVTDEQGDCHRKGERVIRGASSGVVGMSTMPENTVEVVTQNDRYILVYFYMMVKKKLLLFMVFYSCIFKILWSYAVGRRVKLKRGIESPWSHGEPYGNGFSCNYCTSRIKGGGATRLRAFGRIAWKCGCMY
jgi:hypothetical protein